jgi:hypothetical protein
MITAEAQRHRAEEPIKSSHLQVFSARRLGGDLVAALLRSDLGAFALNPVLIPGNAVAAPD